MIKPIIKLLNQSLLFLLILFSSFSAFADTHLLIWPYSPGLRFERSEDQELKGQITWTSAVGFLMEDWYGSLETEKYEVSTSEGNASVKRNYQDLSVWGGYSLKSGEKWKILGTVGLGLYKERVETKVGPISDSDTSKEKSLFGLGVEWILLEPSTPFTFSFGGKMLWSPDFDPSPQPQVTLKLGFSL